MRDLLDAPRRRAEEERLAHAGLEHHLLVELADASLPRLRADEEHAVETAVGDRASGGERDARRALASADRAGDAIPDDAWSQLDELVRGIAAREHVEHVLELRARELRIGRRAVDDRLELFDGDRVASDDRDDLLREHIERVSDVARFLDRARVHPFGERGRGEEVAAVLRQDDAGRRRVDLMSGATDPLHRARDRRRRLDLHDEIDRAHVDPELERARGDEGSDATRLEVVLDAQPLLARDGAVMRVRDLLLGEIVQRGGDALREAAAVDEDERAAVLTDELEQARMDRRPDRDAAVGPAHGTRAELQRIAEARHVLDRHLDGELKCLPAARVDDAHRSCPALAEPSEEARDLIERALRRGETDALEAGETFLSQCGSDEALEPLQREREVGAALGRHQRVDLVDDDRLDVLQGRAGGRREHEVERFRRRDEDVGRRLAEAHALLRRCVTGPDRDARLAYRMAEALGGVTDPGDRRAQVPLDIYRKRLQR